MPIESTATAVPQTPQVPNDNPKSENESAPTATSVAITPPPNASALADVTDVFVSGSTGAYGFSVTVESPDTGCDQYADWWEVLSEEGHLLYRLVLLHSHVNEQPFRRSGESIDITRDDKVIVRAHMNTGGYGGIAMAGSFETGFSEMSLPSDFAEDVETQSPQPPDCAF